MALRTVAQALQGIRTSISPHFHLPATLSPISTSRAPQNRILSRAENAPRAENALRIHSSSSAGPIGATCQLVGPPPSQRSATGLGLAGAETLRAALADGIGP